MFEDRIAERIRPLAEAFREEGLVRLVVRDDAFELELKRAGAAPSAGEPPPAADRAARTTEAILSDVVGIVHFLRPPIGEGQPVEADRDLAFIESLGIRNAVRSRTPGRVAAVYVSDGQPVEYGQPLFAIER